MPCRKRDRRNCFSRNRFFIEAVSGYVQMMVTNTNRKSHIATMFLDIWRLPCHKHFSTHTRTRAVPPVPKRLSCRELAWVRTPEGVGGPSAAHLHSQARFLVCTLRGFFVWFVSWTCVCRAPARSCWWLESKQKVFGDENSLPLWWKRLAMHAAKSCVHWQPTVILRKWCLPREVFETRTSHFKLVSRLHLSWSRCEIVTIRKRHQLSRTRAGQK